MKKKIFALVLAGAVALSLAACSGGEAKKTESASATAPASTPASAPASATAPATEGAVKDGTYKATFKDFDKHGWKGFAEVTYAGGKITAAKYDYVNQEGKLKSQDEGYEKAMKDKTGTGPVEYTADLPKQLVEKQDVEKVDAVTGATHSSKNFKLLAQAAVEAAQKGSAEEAVIEEPAE